MTDDEYRRLVRIARNDDALHQAWAELKDDNPRLLVGRARLRVQDEHRRQNRFEKAEISSFMYSRDGDDPTTNIAMVSETVLRVRQAISTLAPRYQRVVQLRWLDQLSPSETAHAVGVPVQTVYTRLRRASAELRKTLSDFAATTSKGVKR